ncbi:phosphate ABC transporter ATP-binding protein [Methylosinus sp. H3A]|uniref:phosphate ABC transporter ATP-binding protein n=1 Tax=Methylosinus sp. H3A TaxID=2785786 RepID=UPI0018C313E0|nr:phosphate ABC transporter ATP-binding protein [Methylosinus sp. H3A]MBG0808031.1 phosphate ABC transporter ATP-binding protein [Methylosinus sp. H3A]
MTSRINDGADRAGGGQAVEPECDAYTMGPLIAGRPCCQPQRHIGIENLTLTYSGAPAFENVSLEIYRGCVTALIGPSGCGKTSLLSCLNRLSDLLPGCKIAGRVTLDGEDICAPHMDVQVLRRRVGMIFQKPNPFPLSIRRNLELPLKEHGVINRSELDERLWEALADVGLWNEVKDRLDRPALTLSGGQQQRLCIARALALRPEVLLMDEPCSALDPLSSSVVEELIGSLRGRYTVVIVTHNLAQARRIANYAGFFWVKDRAGALIEFDLCHRIFEAPRDALTAAYVGGLRG